MENIAKEITKRKINRIAYVIRPIWETGKEWKWVDPIIDFQNIIKDDYEIEIRYSLPYSTQQYSGIWVNRAKEKKKCLILTRELFVFKRVNNG